MGKIRKNCTRIILYHYTSYQNAENIRQTGIILATFREGQFGVFLTNKDPSYGQTEIIRNNWPGSQPWKVQHKTECCLRLVLAPSSCLSKVPIRSRDVWLFNRNLKLGSGLILDVQMFPLEHSSIIGQQFSSQDFLSYLPQMMPQHQMNEFEVYQQWCDYNNYAKPLAVKRKNKGRKALVVKKKSDKNGKIVKIEQDVKEANGA